MTDELDDEILEWPVIPEYHAVFVGPCTCEHEAEDHGWGECGVPLDDGECPCEAGWEE